VTPKILINISCVLLKAAVTSFFGLKVFQNTYLRKYITSQC